MEFLDFSHSYEPKTFTATIPARDFPSTAVEKDVQVTILGVGVEDESSTLPSTHLYVADNTLPLPGKRSILVGKYGPFLKGDIKSDGLYTIQNFALQNGPAEYAFAIKALTPQRECQLIDITDPATGEPHKTASNQPEMYVNEEGHGGVLKFNTFVAFTDNHWGIQYYFVPPRALKAGEEIELLTNYGDTYEDVRDRLGYGWNVLNGRALDDNDLGSKIERDRQDRINCVGKVRTLEYQDQRNESKYRSRPLEFHEIYELLDSFCEQTWDPICALIKAKSSLTVRQFISARRGCWLASIFEQIIMELLPNECCILKDFCKTRLDMVLEWDLPDGILIDTLLLVDTKGIHVNRTPQEVLRAEMKSEIAFTVRDVLPSLFDTAIYCPWSCDMAKEMCYVIFTTLYPNLISLKRKKKLNHKELLLSLFAIAREYSLKLDEADPSKLGFVSGLRSCKPSDLKAPGLRKAVEEFAITGTALMDMCANPKACVAAAVAYKTTYKLGATFESLSKVRENNALFGMIHFRIDDPDEWASAKGLASVPSRLPVDSHFFNRDWYRVWQIGYVACAFAQTFCPEAFDKSAVKRLSEMLCVNLQQLEYALATKIDDHDDLFENFLGLSEGKQFTSHVRSATKATRIVAGRPPAKLLAEHEPPTVTFPCSPDGKWPQGWIQKTYERSSGDTKGGTDLYWYTPRKGYKLRSKPNIIRFVQFLDMYGGDEDKAWVAYRKVSR
jgi:hypothetical protein